MRDIFLPGKREENKMLGGLWAWWAFPLLWWWQGLWVRLHVYGSLEVCSFLLSIFFPCPNSPLHTTPSSSRKPQNTIPMIPSFPRLELPVENTCGGKNTKITLLSLGGNPFRHGERLELFFFFTPFCRLDYNKFLMRVHLLLKRLFSPCEFLAPLLRVKWV